MAILNGLQHLLKQYLLGTQRFFWEEAGDWLLARSFTFIFDNTVQSIFIFGSYQICQTFSQLQLLTTLRHKLLVTDIKLPSSSLGIVVANENDEYKTLYL